MLYDVVVSRDGRYSIWPVGWELPRGWHYTGVSGAKSECLASIAGRWRDMRPLELSS